METSFASASAVGGDLDAVLGAIGRRALADLGPGAPPDLAVLFVTPDFGPGHAAAGPRILSTTGARHLLGCSGVGVIGAEAEREGGQAAALFLARLPGTALAPFRVDQAALESLERPEAVTETLGVPAGGEPSFLLLADPYTIDAEGLLSAMNDAWPGRPVLGGLASGGHRAGVHRIWLDGTTHGDGAAGLALSGGAFALRAMVSQGCRPIGRRYAVTAVDGPRLKGLAGKPAADALRETFAALSPADQQLARTSLHLGRVANEASEEFHRGDFLIRNLMGLDPEDGTLLVGDHLRVGQTVQFQLRDAAAATEDLGALLDRAAAAGRPAAGLLFSCGGRGSHLFGVADHDLHLIRDRLGAFPLAGFFCNGEIGPVGPRNFLHGFTSSLALFAPR